MTGEINFIKQKQADVSMIADSVIEVIEIVWCQKTHSFVQIVIIISKIWLYVNEWCWDLCELEHRESTFKENSAICERLIWDDETMFELVQKLTAWLVAQFQTTIVKLAIMQCASDVDDVDDIDLINIDVLDVMQQQIADELDENDETLIVAMNQNILHIDVSFRDEIDVLLFDWTDELDDDDDILDEVITATQKDVQDLDDDEVDDDDISLETDENDEMRDEHTNDFYREIDELDEMRESSDADETDDNEARQTILAVYSVIQQDDEMVEIDESVETDDQLDDDEVELIERKLEADEIDESELCVDEIEREVIDELEQRILETDEKQSIICIDLFFTLVNSTILAFKQNDEIDETDEMPHIWIFLEHLIDDTDELDEIEQTDEMFQSLMWNCCRLEVWMLKNDVDENDEVIEHINAVVITNRIDVIEQIDDVRYANLFRI